MRMLTATAIGLAALTLAGCAVPTSGKTSAAATPPAVTASGSAAAEGNTPPDPKADLTGTCDYDLGTSGMGTDYTLLGEVEVKNTGNIGVKAKIKISWPQFGSSPVTATKNVTVPFHKTVTVRFNKHANQTQIDRLQSWQTRHDGDDGCKYRGDLIETSGQPH